ncbi:MAG: hypothetical protein R3F39_16945 [Myxococcota bacterium]
MSDASESPEPNWRKLGRCSACAFFMVDYGEEPDFHGHCKIHPRSGSRAANDFACPEYKPLAGFDDLTRSTRATLLVATPGTTRHSADFDRPRRTRGPGVPSRSSGMRRDGGESAARFQVERASVLPPQAIQGLLEGDDSMEPERLRDTIIEVIENFLSIEDVPLGDRWHGGTMTLQPANPDQRATEIPIEAFFHKIIMLRDRLRVLEAKLNAHEGLTDAEKVDLQQYVSRCYGSLTTFNVLFKDRGDGFSSKT